VGKAPRLERGERRTGDRIDATEKKGDNRSNTEKKKGFKNMTQADGKGGAKKWVRRRDQSPANEKSLKTKSGKNDKRKKQTE